MDIKELLELNENVVLGLKKLQADLPELQQLKEESRKNLSAIEARADRFKGILDWAEKIEEIENLADRQAKIIDTLMEKIEGLDARMDKLEERLNNICIAQIKQVISTTPNLPQNPSKTSIFPKDAYSFSLDDRKSVRSKKPYGILIDGEEIECGYWTDMLKSVIKYGFENYEIDTDELCDQDYGTSSSDGEIIPYFVMGSAPQSKYVYIAEQDLSVYYSGADSIVDVIYDFLCDYIGLEDSKVTIFYHKNGR